MMSDRWRCHLCGEVIGVYEPAIRLVEGNAYETSRASEPDIASQAEGIYHRACFERMNDEQSAVS